LDASPLAALAHHAPGLKEAELRLALALAAAADQHLTATASSRAAALARWARRPSKKA
jgi:hypothetical protein